MHIQLMRPHIMPLKNIFKSWCGKDHRQGIANEAECPRASRTRDLIRLRFVGTHKEKTSDSFSRVNLEVLNFLRDFVFLFCPRA